MNMEKLNKERLHEEQVGFIRRMLDLIRDRDMKTLDEESDEFYNLFFDTGKATLRYDDIEKDRIEDYVKLFVNRSWSEGDIFYDNREFYRAMEENLPPERWAVFKKYLEGMMPLCFFREEGTSD